jgi:methylmalonyl-CoA mutase N-terminal domain/subunit
MSRVAASASEIAIILEARDAARHTDARTADLLIRLASKIERMRDALKGSAVVVGIAIDLKKKADADLARRIADDPGPLEAIADRMRAQDRNAA